MMCQNAISAMDLAYLLFSDVPGVKIEVSPVLLNDPACCCAVLIALIALVVVPHSAVSHRGRRADGGRFSVFRKGPACDDANAQAMVRAATAQTDGHLGKALGGNICPESCGVQHFMQLALGLVPVQGD
jgi:hypothetical protein